MMLMLLLETIFYATSFCSILIYFITFSHVLKFLSSETLMNLVSARLRYCCLYCKALVIVIICSTANCVISFSCTVDSNDRWVVGNVGRCSFAAFLMKMSLDRCWEASVDRRHIPIPREILEKSIFLSNNGFVLYSSFLLIILIILLCMQGSSVHRHGGIVVVILSIAWTIVDRLFLINVDRFMIGTVDRYCGVSFDRRRVLCLVLCSTVACCYESWIINSSGGRLWLHD
ncbi:hypothetical protein F2Q70_00003240 [Brassica cretica]|uniref:Uncharacterized protein n=1 Tax=Brassica cretica TaxID=69181 RepID=A0A8S9J221_BRACR|nr:hypothetical protein F2Q70_00003240 [Brassica cretica]